MNEVKSFHREAMELVDLAFGARQIGDDAAARRYFRQAYDLELKAAMSLADSFDAEPTRSVLLRSAASLALDCQLPGEAEKLICRALIGAPPTPIAEELRDLLEQVNFDRHLGLRGVELREDEIQMTIAGNAVGFGIAPTDEFVGRVEKTETLLCRTIERKQQMPYRDKGIKNRITNEGLELYMSVPRAASFAVTFKVGNSGQFSLPGLSFGVEVIDELLECLHVFALGDETTLKKRISEPAYYRNFVGLARSIAPDGKGINLVGFTASRDGEQRKVALTSKARESFTEKAELVSEAPVLKEPEERVRVVGILKFADSRKQGKDQIQLIEDGNAAHTIIVPEGMMSDIVKPLWDSKVLVNGIRRGRQILLLDIRPLESSTQ